MSILVGACVTSTTPTLTRGNKSYQLITGENLRSLVMGKIVTFAGGDSGTGARCYIFNDDGSSLVCGDRGRADLGRFVVSDDRVCEVGKGSLCWQFFRSRTGGYLIRHLAFSPSPVDEPVCIEPWKGAVDICRPPSPTD